LSNFQVINVVGRLRHSFLHKIIVAIKKLACGVTTYFMDKYQLIGESTIMESFKLFAKALVSIFSYQCLRSPN
jgi:hypothetical protein